MPHLYALRGEPTLATRIALAVGAAGLVLTALLAAPLTLQARDAARERAEQQAVQRAEVLLALAAADRSAAQRLAAQDPQLDLFASAHRAAQATRLGLTADRAPFVTSHPAARALLEAVADAPSGRQQTGTATLHESATGDVVQVWRRLPGDEGLAVIVEWPLAAVDAPVLRTAGRWAAAAAVGWLMIAALLHLALRQGLTVPLGDLNRRLHRLSEGDLSAPALQPGTADLAEAHRRLDAVEQRYTKAFGALRQSLDRIAQASAALLHPGTGATGTVGGSDTPVRPAVHADTAREAADLARSAAEVATQGSALVTQIVHSMGALQDGARRTGELVGLIEGLAFQTNLLALNASVEAAKAGPAGRRLAVVAADVRSLVQRISTATREIRERQKLDRETSDTGLQLIETAGASMNQLVHTVRRVSGLIGDAATGASRPTDAIGATAAGTLLGQTTSAAEQLREQAQRLADILAAFRMAERAQAASRDVIARLRTTPPADAVAPTRAEPGIAPQPAAPAPAPTPDGTAAAPHATPTGSPAPDAGGPTPAARTTGVPSTRLPPPRPNAADLPHLPAPPAVSDEDWEQF